MEEVDADMQPVPPTESHQIKLHGERGIKVDGLVRMNHETKTGVEIAGNERSEKLLIVRRALVGKTPLELRHWDFATVSANNRGCGFTEGERWEKRACEFQRWRLARDAGSTDAASSDAASGRCTLRLPSNETMFA